MDVLFVLQCVCVFTLGNNVKKRVSMCGDLRVERSVNVRLRELSNYCDNISYIWIYKLYNLYNG